MAGRRSSLLTANKALLMAVTKAEELMLNALASSAAGSFGKLSGVFFELDKNSITFVATDAHRLVRYTRSDVSCPKKDSFIVPKKPLNLLKSALPDNDDELNISYNSNHLFVKHGGTELVCRLIDARFPDYKVVIPVDNPYKMTVNKHDFQNA